MFLTRPTKELAKINFLPLPVTAPVKKEFIKEKLVILDRGARLTPNRISFVENKLGKHLLVEYYDCDVETLKNTLLIEKYMIEAARATIVKSVFHTFNPWGVSGVIVIEESHLIIHTWPEYKYAAVDLFTCGDMLDPLAAFTLLETKLKAERFDLKKMSRGSLKEIFKEYKKNNLKPFKASGYFFPQIF